MLWQCTFLLVLLQFIANKIIFLCFVHQLFVNKLLLAILFDEIVYNFELIIPVSIVFAATQIEAVKIQDSLFYLRQNNDGRAWDNTICFWFIPLGLHEKQEFGGSRWVTV